MMDHSRALNELAAVIEKLAAPDGCPWDREQTPGTLADYFIEECHEIVAAIRFGTPADVMGELGDLAFLLLFTAHLYEKEQSFTLSDVFNHNRLKMIRRHPHVFGDAHFESQAEHLAAWEKIKQAENPAEKRSILAGIPKNLPPLVRAYRLHSKAASAGFTWPTDEEAEQQVESEWLEWLDACLENDEPAEKHELGDMLFSLAELGRRKGIKANEALDLACERFARRFEQMENIAREKNLNFSDLTLEEKDSIWQEAKAWLKDTGQA